MSTNYNNPDVNPSNANDRVTLADGNVVSDFEFFPPDYDQTLIERNQPQPDPDLITRPQAFADTTDNRKATARRHASQHLPLKGRRLHR